MSRTHCERFAPGGGFVRASSRAFSRAGLGAGALGLCAALVLACATGPSKQPEPRWDYFEAASPDQDHWYAKVEEWQDRAVERTAATDSAVDDSRWIERHDDSASLRAAQRSGRLEAKVGAYRTTERRDLAESIFDWTRSRAREHYDWDESQEPVDDHWPTYDELISNNGDDCDGLDLIAYQLLKDFGYPPQELFRAIVRRNRDSANHMVTLWFEDRSDPWVFDATGAMTMKLRRFSEIQGWTPTKVFNETHQYVVGERTTRFGRAEPTSGRSALD